MEGEPGPKSSERPFGNWEWHLATRRRIQVQVDGRREKVILACSLDKIWDPRDQAYQHVTQPASHPKTSGVKRFGASRSLVVRSNISSMARWPQRL